MPKAMPPEDHIREAAYHLWREEGEPHGRDQDFWYRAEAALTAPKPRKALAAKKTAAKAAKPKAAAKPRAKSAKPAAS